MITRRTTGLKPQSGAAFNFIYTVQFGLKKQIIYGVKCAQVLELYLVPLSCHGEKEGKGSCKGGSRRCVCQVCLSHLRLSAPYANGQGAGRDGSMGNCWC